MILFDPRSAKVERKAGGQESGLLLRSGELPVSVVIVGAIRKAGAYRVESATLSEALRRGGLISVSDLRKVRISRVDRARGERVSFVVNALDLLKGEGPDFILAQGDTIFVPERLL